MPLATIFAVCLLLVSSSGGALAYPGLSVDSSSPTLQEASPASASPQEPQQAPPPEAQPSPPPPPPANAQPNASPTEPSGQQPTKSEPGPPENTQPGPTAAQPSQKPEPESANPPAKAEEVKPKTATSTRRKATKPHRKRRQAANSTAGPAKVVVPNGGAGDPAVQISPSLTTQQASSQRQNVDQLLTTADGKLKKLSGRQLNSGQQAMARQARVYMDEARTAVARGDLQRANNLATKASLLADELIKP